MGPLQVASNGKILPLGGAKQRAVLALLLLHANEVVSADRLIDDVWGDVPPESAANMLQGYVSHLRKTLEPERVRGEYEVLVSRAPGYMLQLRREQFDAERFEQLGARGRLLLSEGDARAAAEELRSALALWRGPALDDLAYEAFARADIDRLEELRLQTQEDRIDADLALGMHDALVGELRELVEQHPLRERLRAQLMAALYRSGRQADALDVYRSARRTLHDELGIEPGPALRDLEQAILRQDPALGTPATPPVPLVTKMRRRWPLVAVASALAAALLAGVLAFGHGGGHQLVVRPHSVAVIDPADNAVVDDIPVGSYPGPLAADGHLVYVSNIGDATVSSIDPRSRKVSGTFSLSRAIDLVAVNDHVLAASGGVPGHTPYPPGTVVDFQLYSTETNAIRVGPAVDVSEWQTTIASDPKGYVIWAGDANSQTLTELEPPTLAKVRGVAPAGLAVVVGSTAGTVWASDPFRDRVVRVDADSKRIIQRIHVPGKPSRIAADSTSVWAITKGHGFVRTTRGSHPGVSRIDPATNAVVYEIPLPLTPVRIALGAGSVWVTAERLTSISGASVEATVFRIDPATNRIVARIPLETRAVDGIVFSHGLVWVAIPASQRA